VSPSGDPPAGLSVCLVTHAYGPADRGGVETYVADLAHELLALGHRVVVFHPFASTEGADGLLETAVVDGVDVVRINRPDLLPWQEFGDEVVERAFRRLLWDRRVDVAHFHHLTRGLSVALLEQAWLGGARVVLTLHDGWLACARAKEITSDGAVCSGAESARKCASCLAGAPVTDGSRAEAWVTARNTYFASALGLCDLVTSPSAYEARFVGRAPWLTTPVVVHRSGVSTPAAPAAPRGRATGPVRIGVLSNFVRSADGHDFKGAADLDEAVRRWHDEGPGTPPPVEVHGAADEAAAALFAANPGLVHHGPYQADRLTAIIDGLDYLLLPSRVENYPTVVREAFARGVPVLCSDAGGLPEIVTDGLDGLVFPAGDAGALARLLARVVEDRSLLEQLRGSVRPPRGMAEDATEWAATYRRLVGPAGAPPSGRISAVVATFNRPDDLRRCLAGFAAQTLDTSRFEVVVVDDCSPVPAGTVVADFQDRLDIRHIRLDTNQGLGEARRAGVGLATGDVTLFFDDDDVAAPGCLAAHLRLHAAHPGEAEAVLGFSGVHPDVEVTAALYFALIGGRRLFSYPGLPEDRPVPWHCGWGGRTSYKTSLLRRIPPRGRWLEDTDLNGRLRAEGLRVWFTRQSVQYLTHGLDTNQLRDRARALGRAAGEVLARQPDPALAGLLGVHDADRRLAGPEELAEVEALADELLAVPLGALRATTVTAGGHPATADRVLWHCLGRLLDHENLLGYLTGPQKRATTAPFRFVAAPGWGTGAELDAALTTYAGAFGPADPVELVLLAPDDRIDGPVAVEEVLASLARLGRDPTELADIQIVPHHGPVATVSGAVWLRPTGHPAGGPLSVRIGIGPDELRKLAGLTPREAALALH